MKNARTLAVIAGAIVGLMISAGSSSANSPSSPPPTLSELATLWWQWAYSIPQSVDENGNPVAPYNPQFDPSGANCSTGQRGPVWFLAGTTGQSNAKVTRSCSIPEGVSIFFPVISFVNVNTPGCPTGQPPLNVQGLLQQAQFPSLIEAINSNPLSVTVDGTELKKSQISLVPSGPFEVALPTSNVFDVLYGPVCNNPPVPVTPGIYSPAVSDGYYVWLPPPTPGKHTIVFYASQTTSTFFGPTYQDVTYDLTVVPLSLQ